MESGTKTNNFTVLEFTANSTINEFFSRMSFNVKSSPREVFKKVKMFINSCGGFTT